MKKGVFYISLLIILLSTASCTKTKTELYKNGGLKSQIQYRFGKENGVSRFYHEVYGSMIAEAHMKNGKKEGEYSRFYFNGNREYQAFYKNDVLNGIERTWNKEGQLISETYYKDGKKNGAYSSWYENGVMMAKGAFKNDLEEGKWQIFDERGLLMGEATFTGGSGIQMAYDKNGVLERKTTFQKGLKNGEEIYYTPSGEVVKTILYKDDLILEINGQKVER